MQFPGSGGDKPFCRVDGRSGQFLLSIPEGGAPETVEMRGKILDLDLIGARQGWLRLDANGADFVALAVIDGWAGTPRPSPDHKPAVELSVFCADWPEPRARQLRASSRCVTDFIARVSEAAGSVPADRAVRVRITGARVVKVGKGSSADIEFNIAPPAKWPDRAIFDETEDDDNDDARVVDFAPPASAKTPWVEDDLEDEAIPF